jgi:hypothetical protein
MSRQYPNRSFMPSDNSSSRFPTQNDFSYFQYPPHQQTVESNHRPSLPFNRITVRNIFLVFFFINKSMVIIRLQQQVQHLLHIIILKIHLQLHLLVIHHGLMMIGKSIIIKRNVNDH